MSYDCLVLLGDVGSRWVYLVETPAKFDRPTNSVQTLNINYVGDKGE
jgi:hypothetical protein